MKWLRTKIFLIVQLQVNNGDANAAVLLVLYTVECLLELLLILRCTND